MKELCERDLSVFWHPCSQMRDYQDFPPVPIIGADGIHLIDQDGRRIIDAISSWWCKSLGHRHPHLRAALARQAESFEHIIAANTTHEGLVRLCERLLSMANGYPAEHWASRSRPVTHQGHFSKVFLAGDGSMAVEIALKMALQAQAQRGRPGRSRFAALEGGYHGETVATLAVSDCELYKKPYEPLTFPCAMLGPLPLRSGPDDPLWQDASAEWPAIALALDHQADELAAIIYEPVLQAAGGMRFISPDLIRRLRQWADAHDVFLIADEIAAGMGRCGKMLASHLASTTDGPWPDHGGCLADLAIFSKGLTGGFLAFSACLCTEALYQTFDADYHEGRAFLHSNTYTGNALAIAVANAALDVYADEHILAHVRRHASLLKRGLAHLQDGRPCLRNLRACGMVAAVDIRQEDGSPRDSRQRTGYQVFQEAIRQGAWLRPLGDTLYCFPPLTIDAEGIADLMQVIDQSLSVVLA